jgi:hypothetical protein
MHDDPAIRCHTCALWVRTPELRPPLHIEYGTCDLADAPANTRSRSATDGCASHSPRLPHPDITAETPVWDVPSGMGGTFTVTTLGDDDASEIVAVRVCYGRLREDGSFERWLDWDGYTFDVRRDALTRPRRYGDGFKRRAHT